MNRKEDDPKPNVRLKRALRLSLFMLPCHLASRFQEAVHLHSKFAWILELCINVQGDRAQANKSRHRQIHDVASFGLLVG